MKNRKTILLMIFFCLFVCSCNKNINKEDYDSMQIIIENNLQPTTKRSNYYKLIESEHIPYKMNLKKYIYKTELINLICEYPQFEEDILTNINKIIEDEIYKMFEVYIENQMSENVLYIQGSYKIVTQNSNFISIVFKGNIESKTLPYTTDWLFSINIDILNEKIITLADVIEINDDFVNLFLDKLKSNCSSEIVEYFADIDKQLLLQEFLNCDINREQLDTVISYYKDGKIYISYTVPNALGDYVEVELL